MQIMKYIPKAIREAYSAKLFETFLSDQNEAFIGDGDGNSKRLCDVTRDAPSNDRFSDDAAFNTFTYNGVVTSGAAGGAMGVRYKTVLNNLERNVGFAGIVQDNSSNAAVGYEVWTRSVSGDPALRYRIDQNGVNTFSGDVTVTGNVGFGSNLFRQGIKSGSPTTLLLDLIDQRDYEIRSNGQTIVTYRYQGRVEVAAERELIFGSVFLRAKSKVGDPLTLQIEAVNQRNIELITNNEVRILVKSTGDVVMPALPTYVDNAAAVAAGKVVGTIYRTSSGEVRVVI